MLCYFVQIGNPCNICYGWFCSWHEWFCWEVYWGSPRCTGTLYRWKKAGRCQLYDLIVYRLCWRHSSNTWRWRPFSSELLRGDHLKSTISSLVVIICFPRWPPTRISLGGTGPWLCAWSYVEYSRVVKLGRAWKLWLLRRVTFAWQWIKLIHELP